MFVTHLSISSTFAHESCMRLLIRFRNATLEKLFEHTMYLWMLNLGTVVLWVVKDWSLTMTLPCINRLFNG